MARYERLNTNQDDLGSLRRSGYTTSRYNNDDDDDDDENEEIELSIEHHIPYEDTNSPDTTDSYPNGYGGSLSSSGGGGINGSTDASIAVDSVQQKLPGSRLMHMAIGTLATILLYLTLSICLTFYQKAIIKKYKFPLTIVSYHLVIKFLLSVCVRTIYTRRTGKSRVMLDWRTSVRKMAPTGIASGIDIGFSNWGLELVPISLYTMTKSSTIVFILFFAILLGLEKKSWSLVMIVGLIATGLFMFTYKSTQFDTLGFLFILVASLSSGVRWSFAQFVMQKTKLGLHNPVDMIYHMQPWMIASLIPFLITFESQKLYDILRDLSTIPYESINKVIAGVTLGAVLAFMMEVSEFLVLSKTSSLTLSIAGIFKDICQLALAVSLNGDQLSLINVLGLAVCLAGISCHLVHKYATLKRLEELSTYDDDDGDADMHYNETDIGLRSGGGGLGGVGSGNGGGGLHTHGHGPISHSNHSGMVLQSVKNAHSSAQMVPLLDQTDTDDDDSGNDGDEQSASDVIFDVLKRRDIQR